MTGRARAQQVVVIGVGQLRHNRDRTVDDAREPMDLLLTAAHRCAADAGLDPAVLRELDLLDVVQIVSWNYHDAAAAAAHRLGATNAVTSTSGVGGHQPVARLLDLARRLGDGEGGLALLAGAEAQSSLDALAKAGVANPWPRDPGGMREFPREVGGTERMWDLGLVAPIRVYPLFENRLRAELGQSFAESQDWSARLYSAFSEIATTNDAAWNPTPATPAEIRTVGPDNRMICFPYPLRMNAFAGVDQAAAVLLATAETADALGVPAHRRIAVVAGAEAADSEDVLDRPGFGASPGLDAVLDRALARAGRDVADLDVIDLYSCFPVVPKLAALHLDATDRPVTATGGLSSFGGPHNDYSTHALVATVRALRAASGTGLVYANGEYLTRHAAVVLSSDVTATGAPVVDPVDPAPPGPAAPAYLDGYTGAVTVETYTVEYDRTGEPARAYVVARTPRGERTAARASRADAHTLAMLVDEDVEPVGRGGSVVAVDGRRTFVADRSA
ncbi:acetyl-CoA C-acetyltransferase [Jatrophihabitans endophyticus]|uniref:Acetyl-CoA C-acetyltransferase n=1 Tax=Jatrophihabitans endophyticus TaxID=1206085 RepID=A0A1M5PRS8_9ACTN|nr:acetyl-CoA acetyltransferase [Jatrophihabitans endophyticus]SHH04462.1 acetyl-CoA C-acetyltransferase [Jatrophihabitans endophyticus]